MRILIVEDEQGIANFIRDGLTEEGFAVDVARDGTTGLDLALTSDYDVILLDWMLPGMSGIEVCRQIRKKDAAVPIIFLTARDATQDVVFGLDTGANDYIKKPLQFDELLARIRVQLRAPSGGETTLRFGTVVLDPESHQVLKDGHEIQLTAKEFALLEFLMRNKGKVCSRTRIIEHVWDMHFDADTSVIDVYINYLRKKLDGGAATSCIQTVRGVGYVIRDEP
jgi:DNA-binding response OmpR family regulator